MCVTAFWAMLKLAEVVNQIVLAKLRKLGLACRILLRKKHHQFFSYSVSNV